MDLCKTIQRRSLLKGAAASLALGVTDLARAAGETAKGAKMKGCDAAAVCRHRPGARIVLRYVTPAYSYVGEW